MRGRGVMARRVRDGQEPTPDVASARDPYGDGVRVGRYMRPDSSLVLVVGTALGADGELGDFVLYRPIVDGLASDPLCAAGITAFTANVIVDGRVVPRYRWTGTLG